MAELHPPAGWESNIQTTQRLGDGWLKAVETPLARVPSAIVSHTWNYLLNPLHPDAGTIRIAQAYGRLYDPRLLRLRKLP